MRKIDQFCGRGIFVRGYIILDSYKPLHIFEVDNVTTQRYRNEIIEAYVRYFQGAASPDFFFFSWMIIRCHAEIILLIIFMKKMLFASLTGPQFICYLNRVENVWDCLERTSARRHSPTMTF
ncbi:hypothetical protein NPIL_43341 [Nephila pilipes]|uniref:Uncharacterized protein n=1 Tax=Nephila pilipes TaxID=299642 RepID=A0A8X6TTP8_NEPPI|nr:hypothetical protein NPIL_43341 [Nephila pilipes]